MKSYIAKNEEWPDVVAKLLSIAWNPTNAFLQRREMLREIYSLTG